LLRSGDASSKAVLFMERKSGARGRHSSSAIGTVINFFIILGGCGTNLVALSCNYGADNAFCQAVLFVES